MGRDRQAEVLTSETGNTSKVSPPRELYDERRLIPLAADGVRVYWLEQRRFNFNGIDANTPTTSLVRFYDYEPLTGAAVSQSVDGEAAVMRTLPRGALAR